MRLNALQSVRRLNDFPASNIVARLMWPSPVQPRQETYFEKDKIASPFLACYHNLLMLLLSLRLLTLFSDRGLLTSPDSHLLL